MNISDMTIDKVLYKEFTDDSNVGMPFTFRSKTDISLDQDAKEISAFIPKISGSLRLSCRFTSNVGSPSYTGYFSIYVDNVLWSEQSVTSSQGKENFAAVDISFRAFSTIKIVAYTNSDKSNSAYVSFSGAIIDKTDKYMIEVI